MSTAKCRKNEFVELVLRGDSPEVGRFFRTDPQSRGKIIVTIRNACVPFLTWTHFRSLIRVENESAREWYLQEGVSQTWSSRTLDRNNSTQYYGRLLISKNTAPVKEEMVVKTSQYQNDKLEFVKNPVVAEFLGLKNNIDFTESELEQSIITHIQNFLMELGKGYAFIAGQQHIRTEQDDYYIDLVFYNYILKCFVLVDLKREIERQKQIFRLQHED